MPSGQASRTRSPRTNPSQYRKKARAETSRTTMCLIIRGTRPVPCPDSDWLRSRSLRISVKSPSRRPESASCKMRLAFALRTNSVIARVTAFE